MIIVVIGCSLMDCTSEQGQRREGIELASHPDTVMIVDSVYYIVTKFVKSDTHEDAIDPSDTFLTKCMIEKAMSTTSGMIDCYYAATEHKLREIDKLEQELFKVLLEDDSTRFIADTSIWHSYFRIESKFLFKTFYTWTNYQKYDNLGREACIDQAEWRYKLSKNRFDNLSNYYQRISN